MAVYRTRWANNLIRGKPQLAPHIATYLDSLPLANPPMFSLPENASKLTRYLQEYWTPQIAKDTLIGLIHGKEARKGGGSDLAVAPAITNRLGCFLVSTVTNFTDDHVLIVPLALKLTHHTPNGHPQEFIKRINLSIGRQYKLETL